MTFAHPCHEPITLPTGVWGVYIRRSAAFQHACEGRVIDGYAGADFAEADGQGEAHFAVCLFLVQGYRCQHFGRVDIGRRNDGETKAGEEASPG